jgi:AraC-like DNA-binding protein
LDGTKDYLSPTPWEDTNPVAAAFFGPVVSHPRFANSAQALAANTWRLIGQDRVLDSVVKDAGRYVVAMWALDLHARHGLTLPNLKAACVRSGLLSAGRARTLLLFLEHIGYVTRVASAALPVSYEPTERFLAAWRPHLRMALAAASLVEPRATRVADALDDPAVAQSFHCHHAEALLGAVSTGEPYGQDLVRIFLHASGGAQILALLLECSEGGLFPPRRAGPVAISALSKRCGVSRPHIKRIFEAAERAGLLRWRPDGVVDFEELAREQLVQSYAAQIAHLLAAAARTARDHGLSTCDARRRA